MIDRILQTLIEKNNGNTDFLECSASPKYSQCKFDCSSIYNYEEETWFETAGTAPGEYVQIHIKNMHIKASGYWIQSHYHNTGESHLKSWIFEGSNDGLRWNELDTEKGVSSLNGKYYSDNFTTKTNHHFYSYFRLTQRENWQHLVPNRLSLSKLDLHGELLAAISETHLPISMYPSYIFYIYIVALLK